MTRPQLRATVRWESVIIALLGTVLGLVHRHLLRLGHGHGRSRTRASTPSRIPVGQLAVVAVVAAIAGVVAAVLPARRAAKLDVLEAIATT